MAGSASRKQARERRLVTPISISRMRLALLGGLSLSCAPLVAAFVPQAATATYPPAEIQTMRKRPLALGRIVLQSTADFHSMAASGKGAAKQSCNHNPVPLGEYHDSALDMVWIRLLCERLAQFSGASLPAPEAITYETFVDLARGIQLNVPDVQKQREIIALALESVLPAWFLVLGKGVMGVIPPQVTAEVCAFMCGPMFKWLIGPATVESSTIVNSDGVERLWHSTVKVEKCRYLESSGCKGTCMNLCKVPTESFFTDKLGLNMRMEPDFDDMSCKFIFGAEPIPIEEDPLMKEACYQDCPAAAMARRLAQDSECKSMPPGFD